MLADQLRQCGNAFIKLADALVEAPCDDESEEPAAHKPVTWEDARKVLADKASKNFEEEVRALLVKYGAKNLKDIDSAKYPALLAEAEALGNG